MLQVVVTLHFALALQLVDLTPHLHVSALPVGVQASDRGERHLAPLTSRHIFVIFIIRLYIAPVTVILPLLLRPGGVAGSPDARLLVNGQFGYRPEIIFSPEI